MRHTSRVLRRLGDWAGSRPVRRRIAHRSAVSAALGLAVLVSATGIAHSHSAQSSAKGRAPLRAVLYLTAPIRPGALAGRPAPQQVLHGQAAVKRDLGALVWARADAAVVPWATPGSAADARLAALLAAISSTRAQVRVAALIDRPSGTEAAQLHALVTSRARSRDLLAHRLEDRRLRRPRRSLPRAAVRRRGAGERRGAACGSRRRPSRLWPLPRGGRRVVPRHGRMRAARALAARS